MVSRKHWLRPALPPPLQVCHLFCILACIINSTQSIPAASTPEYAVTARRIQGTNQYHIAIAAPDAPGATLPTLFIDVLDISGSMGNASVDTSRQKGSEAGRLTRSDLVRHAVATQIELLKDDDELAIVLFGSIPLLIC